jgi:hypothetical protein
MGLFNKKVNPREEVVGQYLSAMRMWCERVNAARDAGADASTMSEVIAVAGDIPKLRIEVLQGQVERDRAIAIARASINNESGRLSRQDVLRGRSAEYWEGIGETLYADLPTPSY